MARLDDTSNWYTSGRYEQVAISAGGGLGGRLFHGQIERGIDRSARFPSVLEVGALTSQHLPHVKHQFDSWVLSDVVSPDTDSFGDPPSHICTERCTGTVVPN